MPKKELTPQSLKAHLHELGTFTDNQKLIVAYSGGLDSTVLLHLLKQANLPNPLIAVHVNHHLHADAGQWAAHCGQFCQQLGVPLHVEHITIPAKTKQGLEAEARERRYQALAKYIQKGDVLCTAHHSNDQAETVLWQLIRGTGTAGLAGMPAIKPFEAGWHLRPLLAFSREQLKTYAEKHKLEWIEDSSNASLDFSRNILRHEILPQITKHWPHAINSMVRQAQHAAEAEQLLNEMAARDLALLEDEDQHLAIPELNSFIPAQRSNVLRHWCRQHTDRTPSQEKLLELIAALQQPTQSKKHLINWEANTFAIYQQQLSLISNQAEPDPDWQTAWDPSQPLVEASLGWQLQLQPTSSQGIAHKWLEAAPWQVKLRQEGETILLPGQTKRQKIKKLLQAARIPPWQRAALPFIYINGELAAVADLWVAAPFYAEEGALQFQLKPL